MKRFTMTALAAFGWLVLAIPEKAPAQFFTQPTNPYVRPPISPYLNLLRGGNPALNYYGIVRPQQQFSQSIQQLQQAGNVPYGPPLNGEDGWDTGHPAQFMNYSHYYYNNPGSSGPLNGRGAGGYRPATVFPYPQATLPQGTLPAVISTGVR